MISLAEIQQIMKSIPEPQPVTHRLYHDDQGKPLFYSMEYLPGSYIEIDQATFVRSSPWVRVTQGRLQEYRPWSCATKLQPSESGTPCSPYDVAIVVTHGEHQKWSVKYHAAD